MSWLENNKKIKGVLSSYEKMRVLLTPEEIEDTIGYVDKEGASHFLKDAQKGIRFSKEDIGSTVNGFKIDIIKGLRSKYREFYDKLDPSQDIFRYKSGAVACISTPEAIIDEKTGELMRDEKTGELKQKFSPSQFNYKIAEAFTPDYEYSLFGCKFIWKGKSDFVGGWHSVVNWFKIAKLKLPNNISEKAFLDEKNIPLFLGKFAVVFGGLTESIYDNRPSFKLQIWQVLE